MIAKIRSAVAGLALLATIAACGGTDDGAGGTDGGGMSVSVTTPAADATLEVPFDVELTASVPLGPTESGKHHVHVWFDGDDTDYQVVEAPTVQITDLAAGAHVMHVSLRNANHSAAGAETEVPITVSGGAGGPATPAATDPATPATEPDDPYGY